MAKPKFHVQHFVACPKITVGHAAPRNPYTLHDVKYTFDFDADREFPIVEPVLWTFVRIIFTGSGVQDFVIQVVWLDSPAGEEECRFYMLPPIAYGTDNLVLSKAWKLSFLRFPGRGRYSLRLSTEANSRVLAEEFIEVRVQP